MLAQQSFLVIRSEGQTPCFIEANVYRYVLYNETGEYDIIFLPTVSTVNCLCSAVGK